METVGEDLCFPQLLNSSCRKPQSNTSEAYITYVLLFFLSLFTSLFNLLVIISIAHFRQLHSATNLILLSLAISDFLIGLVVIPILGYMWRSCWLLGDLLCTLYYFLPSILTTASVGTVVLISVDRYLAICEPLHYQTRMTDKVVSIGIALCWIYAFVYTIFVSLENLTHPGEYNSCYGECMAHFSKEADIILVFVIPVSIIVILNIRVFVMAMSQARAMRSHVTATMSSTSTKSEVKAAKNLGIVVLVYLICYCPYYCVAYSGITIFILGTPIDMVMLFPMLINSCLNPIIYAMLYPWFRKAIEVIVTLRIMKSGSCDLIF